MDRDDDGDRVADRVLDGYERYSGAEASVRFGGGDDRSCLDFSVQQWLTQLMVLNPCSLLEVRVRLEIPPELSSCMKACSVR